MPKQIVNFSDTIKTFQQKVNIVSADVGRRGNLTTTQDSDVIGAINEHDAELGTITASAMGTTASTVSTAIRELDGRLDSANTTQINSAKLFMRDSAALNIIKGNLNLHGDMDIDGTLTVDGVVNFKAGTNGSVTLGDANTDNVVFSADVNSHIIPNTDNTYDLGTNSQQWRNIHVNGTGYIDAVSADTLDVNTSATIATAKVEDLTNDRVVIVGTGGELEDHSGLTYNGSTLTVAGTIDVNTAATIATAKVEDLTNNRVVIVGTGGELEDDAKFTFDGTTFNLNGNVDVGSGLDVTGNITVTGTVDGRDILVDGQLLDTLDGELGTISAAAMGTTASTVSGAILELETEIDTLNTRVSPGTAFGSSFTATTVMGALNELKTQADLLDSGSSDQISQIGDLATLDTTAKGNLVAAINELDDRIDTDADFRNKVSATDAGGDGSFAYNQSTGVFTYTGPSASETRAHFSGGTDIGISNGTINHDAITSNTSTATAATPGYGGSFTYVNGITVSAQGHVTDVETKQITLPAAYSHPLWNGDDIDIDTGALTGAVVISDLDINITTDGLGHTRDANGTVATRTLTLADLGYTGATDANNYSLPLATNTVRGGIELFNNTDQSVAANTVTTTAGRTYGLQLNSANQGVINVPWTDTVYSHPTHDGDDASIDTGVLTGATVISDLDFNVTTDTLGHVTDANATVSTRDLTLANLGYTGTTDANTYSHPNHTGDVTSTGDGATSIANDAVSRAKLKDEVSLIIYNSAGSALKTLYGAGS